VSRAQIESGAQTRSSAPTGSGEHEHEQVQDNEYGSPNAVSPGNGAAPTGTAMPEAADASAGLTADAGPTPGPAIATPTQAITSFAMTQTEVGPGRAVDMQKIIDSVRATVELAARQGSAQARIALQPQELGEIRIHLTQTSGGLLARVTANAPGTVQALAEGRSELHQSLSSLGVSLLHLDVGSDHAQAREQRSTEQPGGSNNGGRASAESEAEDANTAGEAAVAAQPAWLADGGLINVLA
jgi:flagellar hook-length control protein FliK